MTLSDFIATVLVLVGKGRWNELTLYLTVIQEWQKTNANGNISDLTEVKAAIKGLRDLIIANQEILMAKNAEVTAAMDAFEAEFVGLKNKMVELNDGVMKEIEQLKAVGTGGSGDGLSATEADAVVARFEALKAGVTQALATAQTGVDALKADD